MQDLDHATQHDYETLLVRRDNAVCTVTLNRPERRNALTEQMYHELAVLFAALTLDPSVRVLVVRGAGGAFCSGAEVGQTMDERIAGITRMRRHSEVSVQLHRLPMPTIAVVEGAAVGAGCNLALGCDLVVATEGGFFAELFVKRGMGFDWGGSWLLPRLVGLRKAKELAFFGGRIYGPEAEAIGLINRVVPADELDAFVAEWATELAESAPLALTMLKEELHASSHPPFTAMIGLETYGQIAQRSTADATEGFQSFLEKRPARFEGL